MRSKLGSRAVDGRLRKLGGAVGLSLGLVLAAASGAASAGQAGSQPPAATPPPKPDPGAVIECRDFEVTGSHIGRRRECRTRREWADLEDRTKLTIDQNTIIGQSAGKSH